MSRLGTRIADHILNDNRASYVRRILDNTDAEFCLAGGFMTSMARGVRVNDYDLFPYSFKDAVKISKELKRYLGVGFVSDTALTFTAYMDGGGTTDLQVCVSHLLTDPANTAETTMSMGEIITTFDFEHCRAAHDPRAGTIEHSEDFLAACASKELLVTRDSMYPLSQVKRMAKFVSKGWTISARESLKLAAMVTESTIDSWDTAKQALGGAYGDVQVFNTSADFSMDALYEQLDAGPSTNVRNPPDQLGFDKMMAKLGYEKPVKKPSSATSLQQTSVNYFTGERQLDEYTRPQALEPIGLVNPMRDPFEAPRYHGVHDRAEITRRMAEQGRELRYTMVGDTVRAVADIYGDVQEVGLRNMPEPESTRGAQVARARDAIANMGRRAFGRAGALDNAMPQARPTFLDDNF